MNSPSNNNDNANADDAGAIVPTGGGGTAPAALAVHGAGASRTGTDGNDGSTGNDGNGNGGGRPVVLGLGSATGGGIAAAVRLLRAAASSCREEAAALQTEADQYRDEVATTERATETLQATSGLLVHMCSLRLKLNSAQLDLLFSDPMIMASVMTEAMTELMTELMPRVMAMAMTDVRAIIEGTNRDARVEMVRQGMIRDNLFKKISKAMKKVGEREAEARLYEETIAALTHRPPRDTGTEALAERGENEKDREIARLKRRQKKMMSFLEQCGIRWEWDEYYDSDEFDESDSEEGSVEV